MTESAARRFAWQVFGLVVVLLVGAMLASFLGVRASGAGGEVLAQPDQAQADTAQADTEQPDQARSDQARTDQDQRDGEVVVVGAPGLSWTDIDEQLTPTLWSLVGDGASAGLIVRGAHELTCPADGWLTLGAGQRAAANDDGVQDCADVPAVEIAAATESAESDDPNSSGTTDDSSSSDTSNGAQATDTGGTSLGASATIPEWDGWVAAAERRPLGAQLGTLGSALEADGQCIRAIGPLAALGAATDGEVSHYVPGGVADYSPGPCDVTLVDAGPIADQDDAAALDGDLGALLHTLPAQATLVVAGLGDRDGLATVRAVVISGPTVDAGALHSATTRQGGLVQTTDLTATILALAGVTPPEAVSGLPVSVQPGQDATGDRVDRQQDLSAAINGAKSLAIPLLGAGCLLALAALGALAVTGRRTGLRMLGLAAMAFPSSAFLAGLAPWWSGSPQWLALSLVLATLMAAHVALALAGPWRRHPLGPPAVIAAITVVVIGIDVILGGRLGLISIVGVQPVTAGRFYGMGNVGYGIFAVSGLLLAGFLAGMLRSSRARQIAPVAVVAVLGALLVLIDGAGSWGADFGGVPALVVAIGVLGLAAANIRLTVGRVLLIGAGALVVAAALMYVDWLRPADSRTHLGNFLQSVIDGGALEIVLRKLDQSLGILIRYPVSWVAVIVLALIIWAVLAPNSWPGRRLAPLWRAPLLRSTVIAVLCCLVIGWALNDSGIAVVGIGLAVLIAAAIAILATADDAIGHEVGRGARTRG